MARKKNKSSRVVLLVLMGMIVVSCVGVLYWLRREKTVNTEDVRIFLPDGCDFDGMLDTLKSNHCLSSFESFRAIAQARRFTTVHGGSYVVSHKMPVFDLVHKLRIGSQDPIRITIGSYRSLTRLCADLGKRFNFSQHELLQLLQSDSVCEQYGLTKNTIISLFVQNSYDVYWNISPQAFVNRMATEYDRFWNASRLADCQELNLTPAEVTTLASIVKEETNKNDEKADIASVYLNRIRHKIPLQADPTVRYAVGDFSLRRILKIHTECKSPYNTYQYIGLPPGPICIPSESSIDAVLKNKRTKYLYFCAKDDFSGYHNFAETLDEHNANARKFHKALNNRNIYK
ncbi:MAG: endolytic transglycosylase MltG [Bacteroidales bacterium]|nr:endolytic transglycosylase MltG [Candidatus Colimorpha onthohippi]